MYRSSTAVTTSALQDLIDRIGTEHVERRLKVEIEHEAQVFGQGLIFFNLENWYSAPWIIRSALKLVGLYSLARRNADQIVIRRNVLEFAKLPPAFESFTILHLSDLHTDISKGAMRHLVGIVRDLQYDICVLTGDYRGKTYGPFDTSLKVINELTAQLKGPLYGVLGNHDSIQMTPSLEAMGIRMLFNECEIVSRGDNHIYLAGVDDAHFYRADDIYGRAGRAGFDLMLCGHTHGGQLCLPGGIPIKLKARLPRTMGAGPWHHAGMAGYTSVGAGTSLLPVRLNCPPEITLHTRRRPHQAP